MDTRKRYLAMDLDALIEEHKRLVQDLESCDEEKLKEELTEQKAELEHYVDLKRNGKTESASVLSILTQKVNEKSGKKEWALVSKKNRRVLKWFGARKPSEEAVKKEERRVQFWKHQASYSTLSSILLSKNYTSVRIISTFPFEKYPIVGQFLIEAIVSPPRTGRIFASLKKCKIEGGRQIYKKDSGKKSSYYVWDALHGHWEVYNKNGINLHSSSNEGDVLEEFKPQDGRRKLNL